jgi:hypothetical protein
MDKRNKLLLKSIIDYFDPRFTKIESDISSLKTDVSTINKYISTESKVKEITANKLVEDFFNKNNINYKRLSWKYVYNRNGKEVTDLDGCYIINSKSINSMSSIDNISKRNYDKIINEQAILDILQTNKTSTTLYTPISRLVIIESKNLFNKYLVDKKIIQLDNIYKVIEESKTKRADDSKSFTHMVNEEKIDKLPNELYLILIGHVSPYIFEYIKKCNSGITREEYNYFEVESIKDSFEFKGLSKRIPNFIQKCKTNNYNKLIKIIDDFIIKYPSEELLYKCKSSIKSYDEIEHQLNFIKGKIGYLFYDKIEIYF